MGTIRLAMALKECLKEAKIKAQTPGCRPDWGSQGEKERATTATQFSGELAKAAGK